MITPRQAAARLAALLPHDESPWRVALALAIGVFLSFTPFWGFQTLLALLMAWIFRLNRAVTLAGTWINLPWFAPFVYAGALMEPVRGRMLSRQGETGHDIGHQLTVATLVLARTASGRTKTDLNALAAKWIKEGTYAPFLKIPDPERFAPGPDLVATPGERH